MNAEQPREGVVTVTGLGITSEATPARQAHAAARLDDLESYARKSHTHLWLVILTHKATDEMLDAQDGKITPDQAVLDVDSMIGRPAIVCYLCEAIYQPRLRHRKCPGEGR